MERLGQAFEVGPTSFGVSLGVTFAGPSSLQLSTFGQISIWSDIFVEQQNIVDLQSLLPLAFVYRRLSMTTMVDKTVLCQIGMRYSTVEAIARKTCSDMDKHF